MKPFELSFSTRFGISFVGTAKSVDLQDNDLISVAHRLTTLEMKELNERQRAEHASRMYEQQKTILRQLEDRNFELERKFAEVNRNISYNVFPHYALLYQFRELITVIRLLLLLDELEQQRVLFLS